MEMNEEDQTIGESLHTISKGVHNKVKSSLDGLSFCMCKKCLLDPI